MVSITPNTFISAASVINDLLQNTGGVDAVGVFNATSLQQMFVDARPMRADVRETSQVMSHPTETGVILSDNHIINPVEITFSMFIKANNFADVYNQIKQSFIAADSMIVQTRTGVYPNMIIANMPHIEQPEMYDAILMTLQFKQILYVVPNSVYATPAPVDYSPSDAANSNTVQAGQKYGGLLSSSNVTAVTSLLGVTTFAIIGGR